MAAKGKGASNSTREAAASKAQREKVRKLLFQEAAEEDLEGLGKSELDWIADQAVDFVKVKKPGKLKIRLEDAAASGPLAQRSVLEILNDDMPFLVDSITLELGEQQRTVHVVVHPQFEVIRTITGEMVAVHPASVGVTRDDVEAGHTQLAAPPGRETCPGSALTWPRLRSTRRLSRVFISIHS